MMDPLSVGMTVTTVAAVAVAAAQRVQIALLKQAARKADKDLAHERSKVVDLGFVVSGNQAEISDLHDRLKAERGIAAIAHRNLYDQKIDPAQASKPPVAPVADPLPSWLRPRNAKGHFVKAEQTA